jgi:hypothetical protein
LGILPLARLARSQDKRVTMPLDPHRRISEKTGAVIDFWAMVTSRS